MTITSWQMYWFTRLDTIDMAGGLTLGIIFVVSLIAALAALFEPTMFKSVKRVLKWCLSIFVMVCLLDIAIPSTKEMAAIIIIPKLTESEIVKRDIPEIYDLAIKYLKTELTEKNQQ